MEDDLNDKVPPTPCIYVTLKGNGCSEAEQVSGQHPAIRSGRGSLASNHRMNIHFATRGTYDFYINGSDDTQISSFTCYCM